MSSPVYKPAVGKNGEHYNAAYEGEETNTNLSSSDTSNTSSEPYASFSADQLAYIRRHGSNQEINSPTSSINLNPDKNDVTKEKCMTKPGIHVPSNENVDDPTYIRDSGSYQDINSPTSSINSNPGKIDVTTEKFMTKPGIHVPINKNDFPDFNNRNLKADFYRRQKTEDISWRDSLTWPDVVRPPLGAVPSSHFQGNNNTGRFGTNGEIEEERDPLPITHSPFTYNNPVNRKTLDYEKEEESQSHEVFDFHDPVYFPSFPDNISLGSHYDLKSKKNCHWRKWFVFVFICVCASGVAAWIVQKEYGMHIIIKLTLV
ncbi:uncharacterized protein LOC134712626 [Mytilus trossulus]|uniref:uncharacterized protein LOC134712626 n=1 Tax=Mytilus trossulus TaxID=6551 RepID=UPI003005675A